MKRAVISIIVVAVGCRGKSAGECKTEVEALMTFLRAMDHTQPLVFIRPSFELAIRPELPAIVATGDAPVVIVNPAGIELRGERVDSTQLANKLHELAAKAEEDLAAGKMPRNYSHENVRRVYVVIDARAKWDSVAGVAAAAKSAGLDRARLVVGKLSPVAPPPRTSVDDEIEKLKEGEDRNFAQQVARIASDQIRSCPAAQRVFGYVSPHEGDKATEIIDGIGPALIDCKCDADIPKLRSALWQVAGNLHPMTTIDVTLADDGTRIELPAATTWGDANKRFATGATVVLVAR